MKESCYYCLDSGAVDLHGNTPQDSEGPFKPCPVCELDGATVLMDEMLKSEVKGLHMNNYVWALDIAGLAHGRIVTKEMVLDLAKYFNNALYAVDKATRKPQYNLRACLYDESLKTPNAHRLIFHGDLLYTDITEFLKNVSIDIKSSDVFKLNRINAKQYLKDLK